MRVALIGPVYPYRGGIAHYTAELYWALRKRLHEVLIVSFKRQYPSWLYPGGNDKDPSQKPLIAEEAHYWIDSVDPITWITTFQRIRRYRPDLLIVQWWTTFLAPCFITLLYLYRRACPFSPVLALCHNVLPHEAHWWDSILTKAVLSLATHHVVHSREDKTRLLTLLPHATIRVLRFPPYHSFAALRCERAQARHLLGLDQERPVLLFFGFVRPYKGLEYLIRAVHRVTRQIPVHLLIVGEFWEGKQRYVQQIEEMGLSPYVTIVDRYVRNEEIGLYFGAANVVVLPYLETSQSAVLELAFEMGVPVIASDVGGLRESVRDGVDGLLVKPGDSTSLACAILRYLREALESEMRRHILERQKVDQWESIVDEIEMLSRSGANLGSDSDATNS